MAVTQPLSGYRVLDLTQVYSGPYCGFLLAQAGAEVIKIEPVGGESLRRRDGRAGAAAPFAFMNAGKRSMTLNLKADRGVALLKQLIETADVLLENFRPGVLDEFGLGIEALREINPKLIKGTISGFGTEGRYRNYPAMDLTVQALSGVMACTGMPDGPPLKSGAALADLAAGSHLYGAVVSALLHRERTGEARPVEVAMIDAMIHPLASNVAFAMADGVTVCRTGNRHGGMSLCPYNVYPAADGYIAIICVREHHWVQLVAALQLTHLSGDEFNSMEKRVRRMDEVDDAIGKITHQLTRNELFERLNTAGVPSGAVRELREVLADRHLHETGMLIDIEHEEYGPLTLPHTPLRFQGEARPPYRASPRLGADNHSILSESLGLLPEAIEALHRDGVI